MPFVLPDHSSYAGRRRFMSGLAAGMLAVLISPLACAAPPAPMPVVASFSVLGDMVRVIGGADVALTTIVGPDGDAHSFEPTPKDARALSHARVLVLNGLSFEGWLPRLVKASGFDGRQVIASAGITPRRLDQAEQERTHGDHASHGDAHNDAISSIPPVAGVPSAAPIAGIPPVAPIATASNDHADIDPHAWQSLANGMVYARNIAEGLAHADPAHAVDYHLRAQDYIARMKVLDDKIKAALAQVPEARRQVVTSHDAFGYFGQAYGVHFISAVGFSNEAEPSAQEVAQIIDQVRKEHVPAVFVENITSSKLIRQISRETGARVGGTLYSDALAQPGQPAGTYLGMFEWNAGQLIPALLPAGK